MRHTDQQIEEASERFERPVEALDPAVTEVAVIEDLRAAAAAAAAAEAARADEARLREAVEIARVHGRSWNDIAVALGVSRQAARQRFAQPKVRAAG
ncbi:MAG: sigma-70 family RNA polymerase sigma factor [Actinomycetota bacterium]|nr:sigma-70 family RNA polymerase sigma factor [Actinomycetota bacterium]